MFTSNWFLTKSPTSQDTLFRENQLLKSQIQELLMLEETGFFIELDSLLRAILKKALILCKADSSFFALTRRDPPELDVRISNLILEEKMDRIVKAFQAEYPKWQESESEMMTIENFILLPLIRRHRLLGIIGLKLTSEAPENVCEILPVLARQAAGSLESAILYERMLKRLLVLSNVFILGKEIITNVDLIPLVEKFLEVGRDGANCEVAGLYLFHAQDQKPYFTLFQTPSNGGEQPTPDQAMSPLIEEIFRTKTPLLIEDLSQSPYGPTEINKLNVPQRDVMLLPLKAREKFLGIIQLSNKIGRESFGIEDLDLIKILSSQIAFVIQNTDLFQNLQRAYFDTLRALTTAIDAKDSYTHGHSERVTQLSVLLGQKINLSKKDLENLRMASQLHDIGKIGIPEAILNKPGRLTDEEFEIIKSHPTLGVKILEKVEFLQEIVPTILHHHERFDGKGYPAKLAGEGIPLNARIITVSDTYDAMTSDRPYRKAMSVEAALAEIKNCKGTQFDPGIADAFIDVITQQAPGSP